MVPDSPEERVSHSVLDEASLQADPHFVGRLLANTPDLIYIYDLRERRNLYANRGVLEFLGYSSARMQDLGSDLMGTIIHPEDLGLVEAHHARFATASDADAFTQDYRLRDADGLWRWLRSRDVVFARGEDGVPTQILGTAEDVTEWKQAQEALRASEEKFSRAFRLSPDSININRLADGVYLDINEGFTRNMGYTREDVLGHSSTSADLRIWLHDTDRDALVAGLRAQGEVTGLEAAFLRKDGSIVQGLMSARLLEINGEPCILSITRDITERKSSEAERRRLEAELQHIQKLESIGALAGGVAHDMNNVLAAILGTTSVLEFKYTEDAFLQKCVSGITHAASRGRDLVQGLTDFARKGLEDSRPLDLNEVVRKEADLLARTTLRMFQIDLDLQDPLPLVLGEPSALGNVLMNLCMNARDAMPGGGTLTLRTRTLPDGRVDLTVLDTGSGMSPEVLSKAMDPFFTTKPFGKGAGMGLAVVYGTLKAHGGSVELDSRPGQGTRVHLRFPALQTPIEATIQPEEAVEAPARPLRILVVDDDELVLAMLPTLLESLGHRAEIASGGQEALDRVAAGPDLDLVILDHKMPGMTGAETLAHLRARWTDLKVVISTGHVDAVVNDLVTGSPNVWSLRKPYTRAEVQKVLAEVVAG
jgi:two-component system, cell cycle sensor histidine kinase and response regulator CckA